MLYKVRSILDGALMPFHYICVDTDVALPLRNGLQQMWLTMGTVSS